MHLIVSSLVSKLWSPYDGYFKTEGPSGVVAFPAYAYILGFNFMLTVNLFSAWLT